MRKNPDAPERLETPDALEGLKALGRAERQKNPRSSETPKRRGLQAGGSAGGMGVCGALDPVMKIPGNPERQKAPDTPGRLKNPGRLEK